MPLELPQRVQFRKQQKQQVIWLGKITEKITKANSKSTPEDPRKSTTMQIPQPRVIPEGINILPEKRHYIIDELRLL